MSSLTATPLDPTGAFNWVFLVELLVCGILALFFLFYFNRLFATVISYGIRAWTWHKYKAYIDISALQISLLGGRVFFKSVRYHAHNETILVHDGHITWRYWLGQVQEADIYGEDEGNPTKRASTPSDRESNDEKDVRKDGSRARDRSIGKEENAGGRPKKELPCRISVKVSGVEAFLYNRSPAYDIVVEATMGKAKEAAGKTASDGEEPSQRNASFDSQDNRNESSTGFSRSAKEAVTTPRERLSSLVKSVGHTRVKRSDIPSYLRVLPVKIECKKAAAAVGNENTTSIITAKLDTAAGTIDAGAAGPLDLYKLLFNFDFQHVKVEMKPNRDFKGLQLDSAKRVLRERELEDPKKNRLDWHPLRKIQRRWRKLTNLFSRSTARSLRTSSLRSEVKDPATTLQNEPPGHAQWQGLTRYLDEADHNEHDEWDAVEYGKAATLADSEQIGMRFYWDIPGTVQENMVDSELLLGSEYEDDINGTKPPDYGLDLAVHGSTIVYGPWADRQRVNLQHIFFPQVYVDATPAKMLQPGDTRIPTVFKLFLSIEADVTLRIPTREQSKDFRWRGQTNTNKPPEGRGNDGGGKKHGKHKRTFGRRKKQGNTGADVRSFAWLDIKVAADSTVNYTMDMFARRDGYHNSVDLDIKGTEISSSVNHGLLWRAGALMMEADLSNPVSWNSLRRWPFKIVCDDLELFILRDHLFLITDLVADWSVGPPPEFYTFVPYRYELDVTFRNWCMYLNTNDANLINDPANLDSNDFLTLEGRHIHANLGIPLENYRPLRGEIWFDVLSQDMRMRLLNPPRSTLKTFLVEKQVADLPRLTLKGTYNSAQETAPGNTDILQFDIVGTGLNLVAYGFVVHHLINVKENYFGDYIHFKTLEEFQDAGTSANELVALMEGDIKPAPSNDLDVILSIVAEDVTVMLPTNLYSAKEYVRVELPSATVDLRINNYYMDLGLNFAPLSLLLGNAAGPRDESPLESGSGTQLYLSSTDLSGHRLFGLGPEEPAYCAQWDVDVGSITGECSGAFLEALAKAGKAIAFTFGDSENGLPITSPLQIFDVTFLRLKTDLLRLCLHVGKDVLLLSADPVSVNFNDWAGQTFSQRVSVLVPNLTLACVDGQSASRKRARESRRRPVKTYAFLHTSVALNLLGRKLNFAEERQKQQDHVKKHDRRTNRVPFLLRGDLRRTATVGVDEDRLEPPAMIYPVMPGPLNGEGSRAKKAASVNSAGTSRRKQSVRSKASSASLSDSIQRLNLLVPETAPGPPSASPASSRHSIRRHSSMQSTSSQSDYELSHGVLPDDDERARLGLPPSTMAFSSSYAEPYFPLGVVEPDQTRVPQFADVDAEDDNFSDASSFLDEITLPDFDTDSEHISLFIRLEPGIRAYVEPQVADTVAELLHLLQPVDPEDVLDAFQMSVLGAITARQEDQRGKGKVLDVQLNCLAMHARVLNTYGDNSRDDQVDITGQSLQLMLRTKKQPVHREERHMLAVHAIVDSLSVTLQNVDQIEANLAPPMRVSVDDILIWVAFGNNKSLHVAFRQAEALAESQHTRYLAGLAPRIIAIVDDLKPKFERLLDDEDHRLHLVVYALTKAGENIADPPFLTRMSYVLRSAPQHFRNHDSWKVLARFRHMMQNMPPSELHDLAERSRGNKLDCPPTAVSTVLQTWRQWRTWDVPTVDHTLVFRMLFSPEGLKLMNNPTDLPTALTLRTGIVRVAVDPGERSTEIVLEETALGLDITPPTKPTGLMLLEENKRTATLLQIHTESITIHLDWNLFQPIEDALGLVQNKIEQQEPTDRALVRTTSTTQALEGSLSRHDFHVIISTDEGSMAIQTINLRHKSNAEGLKMSLVGTTQAQEVSKYGGRCATALINADRAVTELRGGKVRIYRSELTSPSIYIDHLNPPPGVDRPPSVFLAGAYGDLKIDVQQEILGLIEIVDSFIVDEVAAVQQLVARVTKEAPSPPNTPVPSPAYANTARIHVALLAGDLHLKITLLQALSYTLTGKSASIRVAPSLGHERQFAIDFDVGDQQHSLVSRAGMETHHQGMLHVPPINGHIGLQLKPDHTSVSIAATVQRLQLEAAAVQGLLAILNRNEVQDVIQAIVKGLEGVKGHAQEILPAHNEKPEKLEGESRVVVFDVRAALLGLRVSANAPSATGGAQLADLTMFLGPIHTTATNRGQSEGKVLPFPEVQATVQNVGASLSVHEHGKTRPCGNMKLSATVHATSHTDHDGQQIQDLKVFSQGFEVNIYSDTASTIVDVINHLQERIEDLDLSKEVSYIRHLRSKHRHAPDGETAIKAGDSDAAKATVSSTTLLAAMTVAVELKAIQISWLVGQLGVPPQHAQDLVLHLASVSFETRKGNEARLSIADLQLQLVPEAADKVQRSLNSALLPSVSFSVAYWTTKEDHKLAFKASGAALDVRLESKFMLPVSVLEKSITSAVDKFKTASATWQLTPTTSGKPRPKLFGKKTLTSLLIEAEFAGAEVFLQGTGTAARRLSALVPNASLDLTSHHGRYGQFADDGKLMSTTLRAPGVAVKVEYNDHGQDPSINGEVRVDASSNTLHPNVVPLILEISNSIKEVVRDSDDKAPKAKIQENQKPSQGLFDEDAIVTADPAAIFGKTKVNLGLRICRQEFGLSCQPIARVDAKAELDDFYVTVNTIDSDEHGHFFAISATLTKLGASVKHVYSREPTFSFNMESIVLSVMNSKHLNGVSGISAILKINPTTIMINAKQLQDFFLFREIWVPPEIRKAQPAAPAPVANHPEDYLVARYQTVSAAAAFPWNATVAIADLKVDVDLGQSIGKSSFTIHNFWASSQKSSNWEQNLCVGLEEMAINSTGRMSGFVEFVKLGVRTSIKWPEQKKTIRQTPLIQASLGFQRLRARAAFDYQNFAFVDIEAFDFLMYNVREAGARDRLVAVLDGEKVFVFCTSTSPAQAVGLYQAFDRLIQEKQTAYEQSLKDIEKHLRRASTVVPTRFGPFVPDSPARRGGESRAAVSLHTDVVVTLRAVSFGAFPSTFFDSQILKLEASNIQTRFAVSMERGRIQSGLGMTLGQLQVALASVKRNTPSKFTDMTVNDVVTNSVNAKGGTILRVPKVIASMQTWQQPDDNKVDYIFKSSFEGKIDVGWNLSRINFIRSIYTTHARSLTSRLGKPLPESAVRITAGPGNDSDSPSATDAKAVHQGKITAEVHLPQSRYEYRPLEPPIIQTPQLRDMGEATPPLEWIGLQRDRLPNVTHQIIIVSLLKVAKEVEDAYERILGSS